jgi:hypothetical protein
VDPAAGGANGDETAYAIAGFLNGNVYLLSCGGLPGGYELDKLNALADKLRRFKLDGVTIEKNMGFGAFAAVFTPVLRKHLTCQIDEDLVTGQKEKRIIQTLAPVMGRGALIVSPEVVEEDRECCMRHSPQLRTSYSLFYQLGHMTETRGALLHDDRADALEGVVRHFQTAIAQDQEKKLAALRQAELKKLHADPLGYKRYTYTPPAGNNILRRKRR